MKELVDALEQRVESLEMKHTYQEKMIDELNTVISKIRDQLDVQDKKLRLLSDRIVTAYVNDDKDSKPPHY